MPIYRSSILKYLKSPSTWIPLIISIIVVLGIGVIMPFVLIDLNRSDIATTYQIYAIVSVSTIASSSTLFSATFAAYKSTQIYKHEIEEGTFLVLISKPISRARIIFEKWLALITILIIYTAIVIAFYDLFVWILDPGYKISNLLIEPISKNIFVIGLILFCIILMLTILFSSIALLISSRFSSASTIASVAGLGALIPVSGVLPTFTLNNDYIVVSKNTASSLLGKSPNQETNDLLNNLPNYSTNKFELNQFKNLFDELANSANTINSSQKYINNIALSSREKNIYNDIFFIDFYYQLNQISSIATDPLWKNVDRYSLINSSSSSFAIRPDIMGKKNVVENDIKIKEMIEKITNTLNESQKIIKSDLYMNFFYNMFNIILKIRQVPKATIVNDDDSYSKNLIKLFLSFYNDNNKINKTLFNSFVASPIISSIKNSNLVNEEVKNQILNRKNSYYMELKNLEIIFLFKIFFDLKMPSQLLFSISEINNYYLKNDLISLKVILDENENYVFDNETQKYFQFLMNTYPNFKNLINQYFTININNIDKYNYQYILPILNLFNLNSEYGIKLKSIEYKPYVESWILILIYLTIAFALVPTSYFVIKKQNIR